MFSSPEQNIEKVHIDPGMKVADLGSGAGHYSIAAAKLVGPSGSVYAVDVQKDLLDKIKTDALQQGIANIELVWADLDEPMGTKLTDSLVDRVIIANVMFQVEDKDALIAEAKRILKPKGKLLFIDWSDSFGGLGPQPSDIIRPDVARTLFESEGFDFEKDIQVGEHHYGLIFKLS
ncbi:methyltransferase domain-containing protein [Candidatus Parcubacteria bacterium]|nr:methyltransferase domain-containing protein [Candidatus Parcubacteria bacterium]